MPQSGGDSSSAGLATEFAGYIAKYLEKRGVGCLSLGECFAAFNRAKGSNWITPKDLQNALDVMGKQPSKYPVKIETLESETLVTSEKSCYNNVINAVTKTLKDDQFVTPIGLSGKYQVPIMVAKLYLDRAEKQGKMAKDDSLAGVRYYKNRFSSFRLIAL
jgi:ribosomal protein S25